MSKYAIELNNITKKYKDGEDTKTVLDRITMQAKHGEFIAIVGPSGAGKSTFLSIAGMLLSAEEGEIKIGDEVVSNKKQKEWTTIRREKIGFIFQNHQLLPFLTAKEQLVYTAQGNKDAMDADALLEELGLSSCKDKYPQQMSGGEKQRTAIARAFMNRPEVILADEPTASLDKERGRQVVTMIRQEVKKKNTAAIMVTHDERVLDLTDSVYRLEDGQLSKVR